MRIALAGAALLLVVLAGPRVAPLQAQQPSIQITAPTNGATITGPVTLSVGIGGVTVKPAAEGDPNAYHYHALVDVNPATVVQAGQPLPTGQANIIHTADLTLSIPNLAPGPHTITVILTKTDHVPLNPGIQDTVQFTVATPAAAQPQPSPAAAAPAAQPRTGTGLAGRNAALPVLALPLAAAVLGGGILLIRRRRNAS